MTAVCYDCKKDSEEYWRIYGLDLCQNCTEELYYFLKEELEIYRSKKPHG
jgi:hypothetical protein